MPGLSLKLIGANRILSTLQSKSTVRGPMDKGVRDITLKMERLTKKATVVDTGRLKSSITHRITQSRGYVGTNVNYASFVEYGTGKSKPANKGRHMEGGSKRFGLGMFGYGLEQLHKWLGKAEDNIARDIERKF